ncbi:MAG: hypothetical protein RIC18_10365 [Hoeflea sp.]|uniref:hypothetical protein n=1 Tax=Hoeflea sp. TaxID=1940281 RepID=UPI0032EEA525
MKKIAIMSASMLVLGAVSLGAADFRTPSPESAIAASSGSEFRTSRLNIEPVAQPKPVEGGTTIRRLLSGTIEVKNCQDAYWPNIPAQCLEPADPAEPTGA